MKTVLSAELVKYDPIEERIITNDKGYAIKADWGETGLLIGKIRSDLPFNGYYNDKKKSEEKLLRNVFKKGDEFFNTGDLLKRDADYKLKWVPLLSLLESRIVTKRTLFDQIFLDLWTV